MFRGCVPILTACLSLSCSETERSRERGNAAAEKTGPRVMIVSFDGLRPDAISRERMPHLQELIDGGSYQATALCEMPSITMPNHATMVTGLTTLNHGVLFNFHEEGRIRSRTIFDEACAANVASGFFATKKKLEYLCAGTDAKVREIEPRLSDLADSVSKAIRDHDLHLLFVHFGEPDGAGHAHGWMTEEYLDAASASDASFGRILDALVEEGVRDQTVIIVTADHGGHDKVHGFDIPEDRLIPFVVNGPGIAVGRKLCGQVRQMDVAATALHLLGLPREFARDGRVVNEAFADAPAIPCDEPAIAFSACGAIPVLFYAPLIVAFMRRALTFPRPKR